LNLSDVLPIKNNRKEDGTMENLNLSGKGIRNFDAAHKLAWETAKGKYKDPVLWSWNDTVNQRHSPPVDCCGSNCEKPAWEVYARVRGGDLKVSIGGGQYEFYFGPSPL
jgi:hypothetical protein